MTDLELNEVHISPFKDSQLPQTTKRRVDEALYNVCGVITDPNMHTITKPKSGMPLNVLQELSVHDIKNRRYFGEKNEMVNSLQRINFIFWSRIIFANFSQAG